MSIMVENANSSFDKLPWNESLKLLAAIIADRHISTVNKKSPSEPMKNMDNSKPGSEETRER